MESLQESFDNFGTMVIRSFQRLPGSIIDLSDTDACAANGAASYVYKHIVNTDNLSVSDGGNAKIRKYLYSIEIALANMMNGSELLFFIPRSYFTALSFRHVNAKLFKCGTITHLFDEFPNFEQFSKHMIVARYEHGNFSRKTTTTSCELRQQYSEGVIRFTGFTDDSLLLGDIFNVYAGAKSGCNAVLHSLDHGNVDFVVPQTQIDGSLICGVLHEQPTEYLQRNRRILEARPEISISTWWHWARLERCVVGPRIYVPKFSKSNKPFFIHECNRYDSNIYGIFPKQQDMNLTVLCEILNEQNWTKNGCILSDGSKYFTKARLSNAVIDNFHI